MWDTETITYVKMWKYSLCKRIITSSRWSFTTHYFFIEKNGKEIFKL